MEDNRKKIAIIKTKMPIEIVKSYMKKHDLKTLKITGVGNDDITGVHFREYKGDVPLREYLQSEEHDYAYSKGYLMALITHFNITNEDLE